MKIIVAGLWHLGTTTATCLAHLGFEVLGWDPQPATIEQLQSGQSPVFEPGLNAWIAEGLASQKLQFTTDRTQLSQADILWATFDTPVDAKDQADTDTVIREIQSLLPYLAEGALVLVSSQLPVGTIRRLSQYAETHWQDKRLSFACSPENLRLGKAIDCFMQPDRIIIGIEKESDRDRLKSLFQWATSPILWMSLESAEMTKHALNAFLATSVVFINEIATLCEQVGANAGDIEKALKSENRIGPKAYLRAGPAIAGGTLARDVNYLTGLSAKHQINTPLFSALLESNQAHKQWSCQKLLTHFKNLKDKTIAILGLTYKPDTDTLRRSAAIETCQWLHQQGARVLAYDPQIPHLADDFLNFFQLKSSLDEALEQADAIVITVEKVEFKLLHADIILNKVKHPVVIDASGFLSQHLAHDHRIHYYHVGRGACA